MTVCKNVLEELSDDQHPSQQLLLIETILQRYSHHLPPEELIKYQLFILSSHILSLPGTEHLAHLKPAPQLILEQLLISSQITQLSHILQSLTPLLPNLHPDNPLHTQHIHALLYRYARLAVDVRTLSTSNPQLDKSGMRRRGSTTSIISDLDRSMRSTRRGSRTSETGSLFSIIPDPTFTMPPQPPTKQEWIPDKKVRYLMRSNNLAMSNFQSFPYFRLHW